MPEVMPVPASADDPTQVTETGRKAVTRRRILNAAARVLSQRGYHGASVDDIVRESGTSKGAFYFHFPSKEEMFVGLVDDLTSRLTSSIESAVADHRGFEAKVDGALASVFDVVSSHRTIARLVLLDVVGIGRPLEQRLLGIRSALVATLRRYLDAAVTDGAIAPIDTDLAARAWFGAIDEVLAHWLQTGEPANLEAARRQLCDLLLRSVGRGPASVLLTDPNPESP